MKNQLEIEKVLISSSSIMHNFSFAFVYSFTGKNVLYKGSIQNIVKELEDNFCEKYGPVITHFITFRKDKKSSIYTYRAFGFGKSKITIWNNHPKMHRKFLKVDNSNETFTKTFRDIPKGWINELDIFVPKEWKDKKMMHTPNNEVIKEKTAIEKTVENFVEDILDGNTELTSDFVSLE